MLNTAAPVGAAGTQHLPEGPPTLQPHLHCSLVPGLEDRGYAGPSAARGPSWVLSSGDHQQAAGSAGDHGVEQTSGLAKGHLKTGSSAGL